MYRGRRPPTVFRRALVTAATVDATVDTTLAGTVDATVDTTVDAMVDGTVDARAGLGPRDARRPTTGVNGPQVVADEFIQV